MLCISDPKRLLHIVLVAVTEFPPYDLNLFSAQSHACSCRRGIKFHTKQSSNPVCTVLNDTHPEIKIHTNSYYKV